MKTMDDVEEFIPFPLKISLCCERDDFEMREAEAIRNLKKAYNDSHEENIEHITTRYFFADDEDSNGLCWNEFEIYIGREMVFKGSGKECEDDEAFYDSVTAAIKDVLEKKGEQIIEVQKENLKLAEDLNYKGYDEILFTYYSFNDNCKAFYYLKKLAGRYPHGPYYTKLRRYYSFDRNNWKVKNTCLGQKMRHHYDDNNF